MDVIKTHTVYIKVYSDRSVSDGSSRPLNDTERWQTRQISLHNTQSNRIVPNSVLYRMNQCILLIVQPPESLLSVSILKIETLHREH